MATTDDRDRERDQERWRNRMTGRTRRGATLAVAGLLVVAAACAMPSTALPVGASVAIGDSMEPTIATPAVVVYADAGGERSYEPGDVVVYWNGSRWIAHRIVDRTPRGFVTRGDNNPFRDQDVGWGYARPDETVAGEVVLWIDANGVHVR